MSSRTSSESSTAPCQRYTLRMPGTMFTHAASRASTSRRAILPPSSAEEQVLNTTILSVKRFCLDFHWIFRPNRIINECKSSPSVIHPVIRRATLWAVFVLALSYAWVALRGPQGIPALLEKRREIRVMEERNANLKRD